MGRVSIAFTIYFLFFCSSNYFSIFSQDISLYKIHVRLEVSGDDEYKVYSYLARELRSLNDVEIVDEKSRFELFIVVLAPKYKDGGETGGIILATAILDNWDKNIVQAVIKNFFKDNPDLKDMLDSSLESTATFCTLWVNSGPKDDLKHICEGIIAEFDTKYLEPTRKLLRKYKRDIPKNEPTGNQRP